MTLIVNILYSKIKEIIIYFNYIMFQSNFHHFEEFKIVNNAVILVKFI